MNARRYYRSKRCVVHREGCSTQPPTGVLWWDWAEGKEVRDIIRESAAHGIRHQFCRLCLPEGSAAP